MTRGEVQGYVPPIHWILVKNTLEETVPPYAVCVIAVPEDSEDGLPTVRKPSLRNLTAVWFNGPSPIPPGSEGQVTQTFPAYAAFSLQDGQTVLSAVEWGTKEDSWCMHPYYDYGSSPPIGSHYGWKRIGPAQGDAAPFVPAIRTRWALFANATTLSAPTAAADGTVADLLGIPNSESAQQRNLLYVYMATGLAMAVVGTSGYGLMLLPASETQMGAVTTGTQTLAGAKTLVGSLTVKTTAGATDGVAITGSSFTVTLSGVAWERAIAELANVDCVGAYWLTKEEFPQIADHNNPDGYPYFAGTFWWAKSSHIRELGEPVREHRWQAEHWIGKREGMTVYNSCKGWPGPDKFVITF